MACPACDLLDVGAGMGYKWIARVVEQWGHLLPEGLFPADAVSWPITCFRIGTLSPPEPAARERKEKRRESVSGLTRLDLCLFCVPAWMTTLALRLVRRPQMVSEKEKGLERV